MKDSKLLDDTLLDLLRMPETARTPEVIAAHLALAANAAGLHADGTTTLQLEHLKLHSAVTLLANQLGGSFVPRSTLRLSPDLEGIPLFASVEVPGDSGPRFTAFGSSAERVLQQLGQVINQYGQAPAAKRAHRERGTRDPLKCLPRPGKAA